MDTTKKMRLAQLLALIDDEMIENKIENILLDLTDVPPEPPAPAPAKAKKETAYTGKAYDEKWFVMQNRLIYAISDLSYNERRLVLMLSPIVRLGVEKNKNQREFYITASQFAQEYGVTVRNAYKQLSKTADTMLTKAFFYWHEKENRMEKRGVSWVSECDYINHEAQIKFKLDTTVIELLTVFDKTNTFTLIQREWLAKLGAYGIILLQLVMAHINQRHAEKEWTIEFLRSQFNCLDRYEQNSDFYRWVIQSAINDIHQHTPIRIELLRAVKNGHAIRAYVFTFTDLSKSKQIAPPKITAAQEIDDIFANAELPPELKRELRQRFDDHIAKNPPKSDKHAINTAKSFIQRDNAVIKHIKNEQKQAEKRAKSQERKQKQAEAQAQAQSELEYALSVYQQLLDADDATIAKFVDDNKQLIMCAGGAEKYFYQNNDLRAVVVAMRHRFKNAVMFRTVNVSAIQ